MRSPKKIEEIQKAQISSGTATEYAKKKFPVKTISESQKPRLDAIEVGHKGLTNLEIVTTMHERKSRMAELSDAIISLPGGVGTWEELFEALAWNQLGFYSKPIILFNVGGYYSSLYNFSKEAVKEGFLPRTTFEEFFISDDLELIFEFISKFKKKDGKDWYKRLER